MKIFLTNPKSLNDLDVFLKSQNSSKDQRAIRQSVPIGVIDDQSFTPLNNLRNNNYRIQEMGDIVNVTQVEDFAIILCDIQGVGKNLNPARQGVHLIREIKRQYPEKYVIAYSGASSMNPLTRAATDTADNFVKKDAGIEEWTEKLDGAIDQITNPIQTWKAFRNLALDKGMTPLSLVELENDFVRSYSLGSERSHSNLSRKIGDLGLAQDVRAIAQGFISSIIFRLIFG